MAATGREPMFNLGRYLGALAIDLKKGLPFQDTEDFGFGVAVQRQTAARGLDGVDHGQRAIRGGLGTRTNRSRPKAETAMGDSSS